MKRFQIHQIFEPIRNALHFPKSLQSNDTRLHPRRNQLRNGLVVFRIKVERLINKDINRRRPVIVAVQLKKTIPFSLRYSSRSKGSANCTAATGILGR